MELKSVREYTGAQYPSLAEYLAEKDERGAPSRLPLAVALSLLALLLGGCSHIS